MCIFYSLNTQEGQVLGFRKLIERLWPKYKRVKRKQYLSYGLLIKQFYYVVSCISKGTKSTLRMKMHFVKKVSGSDKRRDIPIICIYRKAVDCNVDLRVDLQIYMASMESYIMEYIIYYCNLVEAIYNPSALIILKIQSVGILIAPMSRRPDTISVLARQTRVGVGCNTGRSEDCPHPSSPTFEPLSCVQDHHQLQDTSIAPLLKCMVLRLLLVPLQVLATACQSDRQRTRYRVIT